MNFSAIAKRFSEPSSWAGITGLLIAFGIPMADGLMETIIQIGAGVAGLASIIIGEKSR